MPLLHAAGSPLFAIILGSVIAAVFLILIVIVGIYIVMTVRKHKVAADSPDGCEDDLPNYGMRHPVNRRLWQDRGVSMQGLSETPQQQAYNHQRMSAISKAMGRVSNIVSNTLVHLSNVIIIIRTRIQRHTSK